MPTRAMERPPARSAGGVTKEFFLAAMTCATRAWWDRRDPVAPPPSRADRVRREEGQRLHAVAQSLYPDGVHITTQNPDVAARLTRDLTADPETRVLFEAAFQVDGVVARADLVVKTEESAEATSRSLRPPTDAELLEFADPGVAVEEGDFGSARAVAWTLIEVKSGLEPDGHLADLAYTTLVARRAGLRVNRALMLTVNRAYTRDMPRADLFVETDCTEAVDRIASELDARWDAVRRLFRAAAAPPGEWKWACRTCPYFGVRCVGRGVVHPVFELPGLREAAWRSIMETGARGVRGVPDHALEDKGERGEVWWRVRECARSGRAWMGEGLSAALAAVEWPVRYLDFETVSTAVPLYPGVRPYEQVATQYSTHVVEGTDVLARFARLARLDGDAHRAERNGVRHSEFIASDPTRDCRSELVEHLLRDLGERGSVIVYSNFEERILRGLAERFPERRGAIEGVIARLVDLCAIVRDHAYHPDFHGSYSIKTVLPALVPDLAYDGLPIADGDEAAAAFAEIARGRMKLSEWDRTRASLLEYCALDTWAMVRLHAALVS